MSGPEQHEITIHRYPERVTVECSCKMILVASTNPAIPWAEVSLAVADHLRPQAEAMLKELLKVISVKDILKTVRAARKKLSPAALVAGCPAGASQPPGNLPALQRGSGYASQAAVAPHHPGEERLRFSRLSPGPVPVESLAALADRDPAFLVVPDHVASCHPRDCPDQLSLLPCLMT
jgi:hypothetical protein